MFLLSKDLAEQVNTSPTVERIVIFYFRAVLDIENKMMFSFSLDDSKTMFIYHTSVAKWL